MGTNAVGINAVTRRDPQGPDPVAAGCSTISRSTHRTGRRERSARAGGGALSVPEKHHGPEWAPHSRKRWRDISPDLMGHYSGAAYFAFVVRDRRRAAGTMAAPSMSTASPRWWYLMCWQD